MGDSVTYRIEHETRYEYEFTVSTSQHVACLRPRELPRQHVHEHFLAIDPEPSSLVGRRDYFGNVVDHVTLLRPYDALTVASRSVVRVHSRPLPDPDTSLPWETVRDGLRYRKGAPASEASQFALASPYIAPSADVVAFASRSFTGGRPLLAAAVDLMHQIYDEFTFDAAATSITTPITKVLEERRGVCQDFAHFQIACLRALGLPARYVSGYLLTDPPPGHARLIGADASHAWVSIHCPVHGWVDLDPTNDVVTDRRHITVAWGRDYGDVSPIRGVILGGGRHVLKVGVSVVPMA
jgi:transglutaminase-like putative cysteine protease